MFPVPKRAVHDIGLAILFRYSMLWFFEDAQFRNPKFQRQFRTCLSSFWLSFNYTDDAPTASQSSLGIAGHGSKRQVC